MLHRRNRKKSEEGQAMLEFVLVLPVFLLFIAIIFDYGWLFYNYIGLENAGRNAARVACVEYDDALLTSGGIYYNDATGTFKLDRENGSWTDVSAGNDKTEMTDEELHILSEVKNTLPSTLTDVEVQMRYTYDADFISDSEKYSGVFDPADRYKGDVVVLVKATHHAISPFVAVGEKDGTSMKRKVSCKSVYKVERTEETLSSE